METKTYYKNQLTKTLLYAAISATIFISIFAGIMSNAEMSVWPGVIAGLFYAGVPSGWSITGKVFGGWFVTGVAGVVILVVRLMLSVVIGLFALPIQTIYYLSKIGTAPEENTIVSEMN